MNYTIHELINELGAHLEETDRYDAMMIFNNLYLSGYSDLWICIALERILSKGKFNQWKYLLSFDDFIKENHYLEKEFTRTTLKEKVKELDRAIAFNRELEITDEEIDYLNEVLIYPSFDKDFNYEDYKDEIDYWYMKYYFSDSIYYTLKFLFHGTNEAGKCKFSKQKRHFSQI